MFSDVCWTASMYIESVALFPQLYMFQKQATDEGGIVEVILLFLFIYYSTEYHITFNITL